MPIKWNEKTIELKQLQPYERNPRHISESQYEKLKDSLRDSGYHQRIIVTPSLQVIGGHQRIRALQELGNTSITVLVPDRELTEAEYKRILVQDNLPFGEFDLSMLAADFTLADLEGFGMPEDMLKGFQLPKEGLTDPDEVPDAPETPITKRGDTWILGEHRLRCGDSTSLEEVTALMDGEKADMVFTDPPYNVAYSGRGQNNLGAIKNDDMSDSSFNSFINSVFDSYSFAMRSLACIYVCHPDSQSAPKMAFERGFSERFKKSSTIIWVKQSAGMGWQDYRAQHEPILYGWKEGSGSHYYCGDRAKTTVWNIGRDSQASYAHPTQKPVALPEEAIRNSSREGQTVLDLFGGSGSTLIACEATGRKCRMMELDAHYCDVIVKRWENYTGKKAELCPPV